MEHGQASMYVMEKCRCDVCKNGNRVRAKERRKLQAYGRYQSAFVDTAPVRKHVKALMKQGWGYKQVAILAGVTPNRVSQLVNGRTPAERKSYATPRGKKLTKMSRVNAEKLLALQFDVSISSPGTRINPLGARRRAEALVCAGYSFHWQAEALGIPVGNYQISLTRATIAKKSFDRIAKLYDEYAFTKRQGETRQQKTGITRALNMAAQRGYVPAMAWDDIDTDKAPTNPVRFTDSKYVDWAKFEQLEDGKRPPMNQAEVEAFRMRLIDWGKSYNDIDRMLHGRVTGATVNWVTRSGYGKA
jgi:transcriptional regulator with XRE-family HTH domain